MTSFFFSTCATKTQTSSILDLDATLGQIHYSKFLVIANMTHSGSVVDHNIFFAFGNSSQGVRPQQPRTEQGVLSPEPHTAQSHSCSAYSNTKTVEPTPPHLS